MAFEYNSDSAKLARHCKYRMTKNKGKNFFCKIRAVKRNDDTQELAHVKTM